MSAAVSLGISSDWAAHRAEALDRRYRRDVFSYCRRRLPSVEEAEDAAQLVFLNAYRSLAAGARPASESAWLYAIAGHVVAHRLRTIARRARIEVPTDVETLNVPAPASPSSEPGELDLAAALRELPDLERRAFFMREWQGLSYREVATDLGVSETAVAALLRSGRRRLAGNLNGQRRKVLRFSGLLLPWPSLKWLFGPGTAVKVGAGVASVVVISTAGPILGERFLHWNAGVAPHRIAGHVQHRVPAVRHQTPVVFAHPQAAPVIVQRTHARPHHAVAKTHRLLPTVPAPAPTVTTSVPPPADPAPVTPDGSSPSLVVPADTPSTPAPPSPTGDDTRQPSVMPPTAAVCSRRSQPSNSQGNGDPSGPVCSG